MQNLLVHRLWEGFGLGFLPEDSNVVLVMASGEKISR